MINHALFPTAGANYSNAYIDVKDAQWLCSGDLSPVDINNISASQFVIYRFGVFIIRLLHQNIGTPEVRYGLVIIFLYGFKFSGDICNDWDI